jgi:hypothetical protein
MESARCRLIELWSCPSRLTLTDEEETRGREEGRHLEEEAGVAQGGGATWGGRRSRGWHGSGWLKEGVGGGAAGG